jgi:uncharacterized membrane protein YkvA (DUF1232 family)
LNDSQDSRKTKTEELVPTGFHGVRKKAESYLQDKDKAAELLRKARLKATQMPGGLAGVWEDLQLLFRMLKSWLSGDYPGASWQTILLVVTAILYFVMPLDVIPDFIAGLGFFDDAAVIAYIVSIIKDELVAFAEWEDLVKVDQSAGDAQAHIGHKDIDTQDE